MSRNVLFLDRSPHPDDLRLYPRPFQRVVLEEGNTGIGREGRYHLYEASRELGRGPNGKLAAWLRIAKEKYISRNHALIASDETGFTVSDQSSANGTFLNGRSLLPNNPERISNQDTLTIGAETAFSLKVVPRELAAVNKGLFVHHRGGNLRGTENDVLRLTKALHTRKMLKPQDAYILGERDSTKARVLRWLETLTHQTLEDQWFFIHYAGHGGSDALYAEERIPMASMFEITSECRGRVLMILDACDVMQYFDRHATPRNAVVLGNHLRGYEAPFTGLATPAIQGYLTRAIAKHLEESPGRVDPKALFTAAASNPEIIHRGKIQIEMAGEGGEMTLRPQVSN